MIEKILKKFGFLKLSEFQDLARKNARLSDIIKYRSHGVAKSNHLSLQNSIYKSNMLSLSRQIESHGEDIERLSDVESVNRSLKLEVKGLRRVNAKYKQQFSGMQAKISKQALRLGDKGNE